MIKKCTIVFCFLMATVVVLRSQNNVLLIIADDLGIDYISSYNLGTNLAPTPVIDSLANNGLVFKNTWTSPICSPSRANILTGKYSFRTGIGTAITSNENVRLDTSEYAIPKAIKAQTGANSAMFGKWHLGHNAQAFRNNPNALGFETYSGNLEGQLSNYNSWVKTVNGVNQTVFDYATTVTVNDAINWVGAQTENWFVTLSFNAPHAPFHKPPNNLHSFDGLSTNPIQINANPQPYYKAMIEAMDTEIGRFLNYLNDNGQLVNTNIIFIGDNGTPEDAVLPPFNASYAKASIYNGGVQVPLIIAGPSVVNPGQFRNELVNSTDLYKTILELMGGNKDELPIDVAPDSRSLLSIINGTSDIENQRDWIMAEIFKPTPSLNDGQTITNGGYILLEFANGTSEFYNFSSDFFETNPLPINNLNEIEQQNYDELCANLGNLVGEAYCQITGIFSNNLLEFQIYPNPAAHTIQVEIPKWNDFNLLNLEIIDSKGALVASENIRTSTQEITIGQLPAGQYQLLIKNQSEPIGIATFIKL
jgi:arylsulfatase A-like enzyme